MGRLDGQVAIVTGGSRGIGRAVALRFAREGARVAITAVQDRDTLEKAEREIAALGGDCIAMLADVARRGDIDKLVQTILARWGRIDVLVNNAGILRLAPLENITEERWDDTLARALEGHVQLHPSGDPDHEATTERQDHQHRRAFGIARLLRRRRLCGGQGRHHRLDQKCRQRTQVAQHPGQLHLAGGGHAHDRGADQVPPRTVGHHPARSRVRRRPKRSRRHFCFLPAATPIMCPGSCWKWEGRENGVLESWSNGWMVGSRCCCQ